MRTALRDLSEVFCLPEEVCVMVKRSRLARSWIGQVNVEYRKLDAADIDKGNLIVLAALSKLSRLNKRRQQ